MTITASTDPDCRLLTWLAAAERVGMPAVALCSLNWAEIYRPLLGHRPEAARVLGISRSRLQRYVDRFDLQVP